MQLNYNVPQLGNVTSLLFDDASKCYEFLSNYPKKYHYVDKMKNIDQLGIIRGVYEGAHHSRWEYVMVQLSLIHQLSTLKDEKTNKNIASGLGLTKESDFLGRKESGAAILQMWILLFNSGHLPGTYSSERGILNYCINDKKFQNVIYNGLSKDCRPLFEVVVENQDLYNFHKILTCFQLQRYKGNKKWRQYIELFFEVIKYYFSNNSIRQTNLKNLYERIRQLSFLFLDSQYISFPINFDLSKIFFNLPYYIDAMFKKYDSSILRTLDSFEDLLSINVYHSPEAICGLGIQSKIIEEETKNKNINTITELKKYLNNYNTFYPNFNDIYDNKEIFHLLFEFNFSFSFINEYLIKKFLDYLSFKKERNLNSKYGVNNCQLTFQPANKSKQIAINLSVDKSHAERNLKIIGKFLKDTIDLNFYLKKKEKSEFVKSLIDDVIQKPYQDLFLSIINYVSDSKVSFEIKNENISKPVLMIDKALKKRLNEIDLILEKSNLLKHRLHEIKTLKEVLLDLNYRTGWLVSLSPIDVYDQNRNSITDIDGTAIGFRDGKLGILLVQAKNQRRRSIGQAKSQLEDTVKKMGFKTSKKGDIKKIIEPPASGAYSYIILDGKF